MITVKEAKKILVETVVPGPAVFLPLENCGGKVLAAPVIAPFDSPLFDNSAMDGYAVHPEETANASPKMPAEFGVADTVFAGDPPPPLPRAGEVLRIMTGAILPPGNFAVIPQEETEPLPENGVRIFRPVRAGEHVRRRGEEIRAGQTALEAGTPLNPAAIGHLANLGVSQVSVFRAPKIALVPTGNELLPEGGTVDGKSLPPGKIFESNCRTLGAAIREMGLTAKAFAPVADDKKTLKDILQHCLTENDFTLVTGGVSVGDRDYVGEILEELGVKILFHKVAQKPGKPLLFGKRENRFVFGLPGNPASTLVCFYEYARPAFRKWLGYSEVGPATETAVLEETLRKKAGRLHFLRARAERRDGQLRVRPMTSQESHRMASFARANALAVFPEEAEALQEGEAVEVHWIK